MRLFFILLTIGVLFLFAYYSPWNNLEINLLNTNSVQDQPVTGQIFSLKGELDVLLNSEFSGKIDPASGAQELILEKDNLYTVSINNPIYNNEFVKILDTNKVTTFVFAYELGPLEELSQGYSLIVNKESIANTNDVINVNFYGVDENIQIELDGVNIGRSPILNYEVDKDSTHTVLASKEGFEDLEFDIFPETQEERDLLVDKTVDLEIDLFKLPIDVTSE